MYMGLLLEVFDCCSKIELPRRLIMLSVLGPGMACEFEASKLPKFFSFFIENMYLVSVET